MKSLTHLWLLCLLLGLISCAKTTEEKVTDGIDQALTLLSADKCQDAIDLLEELGRQNTNGLYLEVLASAYACRAGFSELTFFSEDVDVIDSSNLFPSLTLMSSSSESEADSDSYTDLQTAIDILLYANDVTTPSQVDRNTAFGNTKGADMGLQALYMMIAQFGKYLHFYGNVNSSGVKGGGAANQEEQGSPASSCFITYTFATAVTLINSYPATNACDDLGSDIGHPNLSLAPGNLTETKAKMCEGLMIITNMVDILGNITLSDNSSLGDIVQVRDLIQGYIDDAIAAYPTLETLLEMTSQSACETYVTNSAQFDELQLVYAALFESGLP